MRTSAYPHLAAIAAVFLVLYLLPSRAQDVALTPPMGWNSWNYFAEKVDDQGVRAAADAMVASGMKDAGYVYVNIDDTWEGHRDSNGALHTNSKFPDMKALADYVHSKDSSSAFIRRPDPRPVPAMRDLWATKSRTHSSMLPGASTTSSTTYAALFLR